MQALNFSATKNFRSCLPLTSKYCWSIKVCHFGKNIAFYYNFSFCYFCIGKHKLDTHTHTKSEMIHLEDIQAVHFSSSLEILSSFSLKQSFGKTPCKFPKHLTLDILEFSFEKLFHQKYFQPVVMVILFMFLPLRSPH